MKLANQDILNLVVLGMREQNQNAMTDLEKGVCVYRTNILNPAEGRACAVGMLITNSEYDRSFELCAAGDIEDERPKFWQILVTKGISTTNVPFLDFLQSWHDLAFESHETFRGQGVKSLKNEIDIWNTEKISEEEQKVDLKEALTFAKNFEKALEQSQRESATW